MHGIGGTGAGSNIVWRIGLPAKFAVFIKAAVSKKLFI